MRRRRCFGSGLWFGLLLCLFFASPRAEARPDLERPETGRLLLGGPATSRNFPYACVVFCCGDNYTAAVSMCSIIDERYVVTSVSNLAKRSEPSGRMFLSPETRPLLRVMAGMDALVPGSERHLHQAMTKSVQMKTVKNIFVIRDNEEVYNLSLPYGESVFVNPPNLMYVFNNSYEFEFPFAFLELNGGFAWARNVKPWPRVHREAFKELRAAASFIHDLNFGYAREICFVPGWGLSHSHEIDGVRRLIYQKVASIEITSCRNAYCTMDVRTCTKYPDEGNVYLICLKSLHYGDMCELDQSAAVYCPGYLESVLALLANTIECGVEGVPPVYWVSSIVLLVYERIRTRRRAEDKLRNPHSGR